MIPKLAHIKYLILTLSIWNNMFCQNTSTSSILELSDSIVGKRNLNINNGILHINSLQSLDETHRYYKSNEYSIGSILYENQQYRNYLLKYDLLEDTLILKIDSENNSLGINLITEKIDSFNMDDKTFVNLNYKTKKNSDLATGFYEEYTINENCKLYIKHLKYKIEVLKTDGIFYKYEYSTEFVINYNNKFYLIKNNNDLIKLFPEKESDLKKYNIIDSNPSKLDEIEFMKNTLQQINN